MILRPYQSAGIEAIRAAFRQHRSVLYVAPTGAGKTTLFSYITQSAAARGKRVVILVHRAELVRQTCETLRRVEVQHGVIKSGYEPNAAPVQVASVQTLARRISEYPAPDLVICDEAHHGTSATYETVFSAWKTAHILGVTATPQRLDGRGLGAVFETLIRGPEVADLIKQGYLCRPQYFAPPATPQKYRITRGDFDRAETEQAMDKPRITGSAVAEYSRRCAGVPAIAFCVSRLHAAHTRDAFRDAGYRSECIDGTNTDEERAELLAGLASGAVQVLVSVDLIGEGVDVPVCTAAILLRPTASLALHLQQIGRVLRPAPGKSHAVILDHAGNIYRHGLAEERREWSLAGEVRRTVSAADSLMQCPACYAIFEPAPACPCCGHEREGKPRVIETVHGELVEVGGLLSGAGVVTCERCGIEHADTVTRCACGWDRERAAQIRRWQENRQAQTVEELEKLARARGYENPRGWARIQARIRAERGRNPAAQRTAK